MMKTLIALTSLLCLTMAPAAFAADASLYASGQCYESNGAGGSTSLYVDNTGAYTLLDADETVAALSALLLPPGNPAGGNGCTDSGSDHLTVVATVNGGATGVCYDGDTQGLTSPC